MLTFLNIYLMQDPREEVIQAWYMDDSDADQRLPHHRDPQEFVSFEKLDGIQSLHFPLYNMMFNHSFSYK